MELARERPQPIINYQTQDGREAARRLIRACFERAVAVVKRGVSTPGRKNTSLARVRCVGSRVYIYIGGEGEGTSSVSSQDHVGEGGGSRGDSSERPQ